MFDKILGLFGDQSGAYNDYANSMRQQAHVYDPFVNRGNQAGDQQLSLSEWLTKNPNALQDQIAGGFQSSPYQQKLMDMMTTRMNNNAANSGMIKSPAAQGALNDQLTTMGGQFMNDYVNRGMGSFGQGFQGLQGLGQLGMQGAQGQSDLNQQGALGDLKGNMSHQGAINNILGLVGGGALNAFMPGMGGMGAAGIAGSSGGFQGAGSLNPNTGGWTGNASTANIMRLFG